MEKVILYIFPTATVKSNIYIFVGVKDKGMLYVKLVNDNFDGSELRNRGICVKASDTSEPYEVNDFEERIMKISSDDSFMTDPRIKLMETLSYEDIIQENIDLYERSFKSTLYSSWRLGKT